MRLLKDEMRKKKSIGILFTVIGGLLIIYFLIWCTGILFWSFDIAVLFILVAGLVITFSGISLIFGRNPLFFIKYRILKSIIVIGVCIFMVSFIIIEGFIIYTSLCSKENIKVDFVLIPGAQVVDDRPSRILLHRLQKALSYLSKNLDTTIIVSGAKGPDEQYTEAEIMKRFLIESGINEKQIIKEEKATNSYENIKYSRQIFEQLCNNSDYKVAIITTDYHLFRMVTLAKKQGIESYGISVPINYAVIPICYTKEYFSIIKAFVGGDMK